MAAKKKAKAAAPSKNPVKDAIAPKPAAMATPNKAPAKKGK